MNAADLGARFDDLPRPRRWAVAAALLGLGWFVAALVLPQGAPVGRVVSGAILGSATALTAVGLILIYRTNRVVNFAYGAMGAATGLTAARLFLVWGWNYGVALAIGVLTGAAVGLLVDVMVIRRFENSSRLVLSVATIGLAQVLGGVELLLPPLVFGDSGVVTLGGFETPLTSTQFSLGVDVITGDHLLILMTVPLVVGAVGWFLARTRVGAAVRAASENPDRARLLGIPVRRIQTLVWTIAGSLATLTFLLKAPFVGTPPTAAAGAALLLPALAAAVVARMESLPVACAAALVLGAVDQIVRWNTSRSPALADVVLLVVILGALLIQRGPSSRARAGDDGWSERATHGPVPRELKNLPEVRWAARIALAALALVAVVAPLVVSPSVVNTLSIACIWGMVGVSLVVLTGWNGQLSLGQFALVGVGAIVAGNLMNRWEIDYFLILVVSAGAAALVSLLLGFPALRISGPFLGVVTLAFAVVLDGYVLNPNVFPELIPETVERPVLLQRWRMEDESVAYWVTLAALVGVMFAAAGVRRSRSGRAMIANRDNSRAAAAMAVPGRRTALGGFVFSGAITGLAGGLHVMLLHGARAGSYQPQDSVDAFASATIGGVSSVIGSVAGTAGLRGLRDAADPGVRLLLMGTGLLVVLWALPGGLAGAALSLRDRALALIARRRHIQVAGFPSEGDPEPSAAVSPAVPPARHDEPLGDAVSCRGVDVSYGQLQVLFGANLDVDDGEMVALLGTNGAGKSTLLKALCGLVPSRGDLRLGGVDISGRRPEQIVRDGLVMMPGGRSIFPTVTVADHLRLATWTFHADTDRIRTDTAEVMELFPSLRKRVDTMAGDLSGGEQQQLALAMTLLLRPRVVLIDELSLGLAPLIVGQLIDVVRRLNASGVTIVIVEQSVNVALTLAERAVFLEKGQVRFEGATSELLDRPDILRSVFLEGAGAMSEDAGEAAVDAATDNAPAPSHDTGGERGVVVDLRPVLECRSVERRFGGVIAVDHVDLEVRPGEIVGLVGQNGAGKTTLMDCISGFLPIDDGRIVFRDHDITDWQPFERARGRLGRSFQEARLFPSLTVEETILVAGARLAAPSSMVSDTFGQPATFESELAARRRVAGIVEMLGLGDYRDTLTTSLSTGTRRIVELACLVAEDPVLLCLDEPSAGVAQREAEALGPLLVRIRDETGAAMVVIEHDMPLLASMCDRMVAMDLGRIIAQGPPAEVLADDLVIAAYLGDDSAAIHRSGAGVG